MAAAARWLLTRRYRRAIRISSRWRMSIRFERGLHESNHGETNDPVDVGKFAHRVRNELGSGTSARNVRKQSGVERRQATRWRCEARRVRAEGGWVGWQAPQGGRQKEIHGQMSKADSLT